MELNVVFGTLKKAGREISNNQKYPELAVVTLEAPIEGKNRKIMFNAQAMELLKLEAGATQNVIFGFIEADENMNRRLLVANADFLENKGDTVVYNTSKNKVPYSTKEKGKSISSSYLHKEINEFLEINADIAHDYELVYFGENGGLDLYEFCKIRTEEDNESINDEIQVEVTEEDEASKEIYTNGFIAKEHKEECISEEYSEELVQENNNQ